MGCGCIGHGPKPDCECVGIPKRPCGCPEGDICCMCCDCKCHQPGELARSIKELEPRLKARVERALEDLGDASYADRFRLLHLVWEQFNREEFAKRIALPEKDAHSLLAQATGISITEAIWKRVCKQHPDWPKRFVNLKVFQSYIKHFDTNG